MGAVPGTMAPVEISRKGLNRQLVPREQRDAGGPPLEQKRVPLPGRKSCFCRSLYGSSAQRAVAPQGVRLRQRARGSDLYS